MRPENAPVAGLGRRGLAGRDPAGGLGGESRARAGRPRAAVLELEPGRRPAPRIVVGLTVGNRDTRDGPGGGTGKGTGTGTRRPGTRGTRRAPGAVSRGMAGRFPCHLCLAVSVIFPADGPRWEHSQRGLTGKTICHCRRCYRPAPWVTGTFGYAAGGRGRRPATRAIAAPAGARGSSGPGLDGGR